MFLGYRHDFGGATNFSNALLLGANDSKRCFLVQTFRDHFFVTWLKNVKRQRNSGKQNYVQGKYGQERAHQGPPRLFTTTARAFLDCTLALDLAYPGD
jgi:hypothetical protein